MKRDWDLIRQVLFSLELMDGSKPKLSMADMPDYGTIEVSYHFSLLIEAGLVNGRLDNSLSIIKDHDVYSLSWAGHDFLDAVRKDTVWEKTKSIISQP